VALANTVLRTLPVGANPVGVALNPTTQIVYVASPATGTLTATQDRGELAGT
jgi:DNA-binding beta-propeller fold protein YncE